MQHGTVRQLQTLVRITNLYSYLQLVHLSIQSWVWACR
jgi:hypothetical protein